MIRVNLQKNQLMHYKGLVRRLNANLNDNALQLYGLDGKALPVPKFDEDGKVIKEQLVKAQTIDDTGNFIDLCR